MRRLLKCGAGVAVSSVAFLTLWQYYETKEPVTEQKLFRVGSLVGGAVDAAPDHWYEEHIVTTLGLIIAEDETPRESEIVPPFLEDHHVEVKIHRTQLEALLQTSQILTPAPPVAVSISTIQSQLRQQ